MTARRRRLGSIEARRRQASIGAAHTWFVRITKFILPLAALVIVAIVAARLAHDPQQLQIAAIPAEEKTRPGEIDLVEARYEGVDDQNRPYTVTASRARRIMGEEQAVALENPRGELALEDGGWIRVAAAEGLYNNTAAKLNLSGGVVITHNTGYEMKLRQVDIDTKTRASASREPVEAQGPRGHIWGQNLDVSEGGMLIVFGGPARLTLFNLQGKEKKG